VTDETPSAGTMESFNQSIIDEFRANDGVVGGMFEGQAIALLTTTGARSGNQRTTPLVAGTDGDATFVIASAAGSFKHPAWYHNIVANPGVIVEIGTERFEATGRTADEPQRSELYAVMVERMEQFAQYQEGNPRTIPVVILDRS